MLEAAGDEEGAGAGFYDIAGGEGFTRRDNVVVRKVAREGDGLVGGGVEGGGVDAVLGAEVEIGESEIAGGGVDRAVPVDGEVAVHGLGGGGVVREVAAEGDGVVRDRVGLGPGEEGDRARGWVADGVHRAVCGIAEEDIRARSGNGAGLPVVAGGPGAAGVAGPGGVDSCRAREGEVAGRVGEIAHEAGDVRGDVGVVACVGVEIVGECVREIAGGRGVVVKDEEDLGAVGGIREAACVVQEVRGVVSGEVEEEETLGECHSTMRGEAGGLVQPAGADTTAGKGD